MNDMTPDTKETPPESCEAFNERIAPLRASVEALKSLETKETPWARAAKELRARDVVRIGNEDTIERAVERACRDFANSKLAERERTIATLRGALLHIATEPYRTQEIAREALEATKPTP